VVWTALILTAAILAEAAVPDPPSSGITTVGSLKLGTAADCAGVVAFSATQPKGGHIAGLYPLPFDTTLVNKGVGYVAQTGIFTTHCPGLYQFSFAGYGSDDLRLTLRKRKNESENWRMVVSTGMGGGSNLILQEVEAGEQFTVVVESGKIEWSGTFSGYRIAK
ncbi:hypothetical protein WN55_04533, partial [Dufourea novaeangliae]